MTADVKLSVELEVAGQRMGRLSVDADLQPGAYLLYEGQTYAVLERRHQYQFRRGRYRLCKVVLHLQPVSRATEQSWVDGDWVLGKADCRFSAQSRLVRCAVNPAGPCEGCTAYEPATDEPATAKGLSPTVNRAPLAKSQPD